MKDTPFEVAVVGGGISGLVAAWELARAGRRVLVLEAGAAVGGCMRTEQRDGFLLEKGPFNVLVRDESFHALLDECGPDIEVVTASKESKARFVLKDGALHPVPSGPGALLRTPLLSPAARLRLLRGLLWSAPAANGRATSRPAGALGETTIHEAAERRFGPEVAETFVSALVAGIFGGDSRALSLDACFPKAAAIDQSMRSPIGFGLSRAIGGRRGGKAAGPKRPRLGLVSFRAGLGALPNWLARSIEAMGGTVRTDARVVELERDVHGFRVHLADATEAPARATRVLLAAPGAVTGRLLGPLLPHTSEALAETPTASLAVVNLGYRRADVAHPLQGYGFLVPAQERADVMGVLWASSAFPHHAPTDRCLIRVFMGGPRERDVLLHDDGELASRARRTAARLLGISDMPVLEDVCRWPNAIPQYGVGHVARVERVTEAVRSVPGLHIVGNALRGVSINDCVREATAVARSIAQEGVHDVVHHPDSNDDDAERAASGSVETFPGQRIAGAAG